jgi:hypothetical protein
VHWCGSMKSFDSKFSYGTLASVNCDVCWLAKYLNFISNLERINLGLACLFCTMISCACMCVT